MLTRRAGARRAAGRAARRARRARLARRAARRGARPARRARHGGRPLRPRGRRRRAGTTCCSAARRGRARRRSPSGCPGCSPTSPSRRRSSSARSTRSPATSAPVGLRPSAPPFRAPHHSATKASVLGGGTGRVHPGEISRALHGVLFLDEFPLFAADIIDALRQPLEHGEVTIARGDEVATFPARTMVVLAANPCPCGDYHPDARESRCTCSEVRRRSYRDQVSGPVTDRHRHRPPHHAGAPLRAARPARRGPEPSARGAGAGGGGARSRQAGAVRRDALAGQRRRARAGAARPLAADPRRRGAARRAALRGPADPPRGRPGAPGRLDRGRPPRARPARACDEARAGAAAAGRRPARRSRRSADAGVVSAPRPTERRARVALNAIAEPGDPRIARLVAELGAVEVHERLVGRPRPRGLRSELGRPARRAGSRRGVLDAGARAGLRFVVPGDAEWPAAARGPGRGGAAQPARRRAARALGARTAAAAPSAAAASVAVVGSRSATSYGTQVALDLGAGLAAAGRDRRVGRGVRHRPGGSPRRARAARAHGRGARLRRRTAPTRRRTSELLRLVAEPGWSSPRCRRAARRRGTGSSAATG